MMKILNMSIFVVIPDYSLYDICLCKAYYPFEISLTADTYVNT